MDSKICVKCEKHKKISTTGVMGIIGCLHKPYKGKWVFEIKECPKLALPESPKED